MPQADARCSLASKSRRRAGAAPGRKKPNQEKSPPDGGLLPDEVRVRRSETASFCADANAVNLQILIAK